MWEAQFLYPYGMKRPQSEVHFGISQDEMM